MDSREGIVPADLQIFTVANLSIAVVLFVFLPMIFVWTGKRFREAIAGDGKKGRRQLIAFGLFVRSLFPGIFVLSLAFLIKSSSFPDELLAIANELIRRDRKSVV